MPHDATLAPDDPPGRPGWSRRRTLAPGEQESANELAQERTDLATDRTLMAADRSLMAWIRTSLSMTSFGFTIYKILQGIQAAGNDLGHAGNPRLVGLFLSAMGTGAMVFGTIEYWSHLKALRSYRDYPLWRPTFVVAVLMSAISVLTFFSITFGVL